MQAAASVSKSKFAEMRGVTPGRVSQWLSEGKISPKALDGEGRFAKIKPDVAVADLRRTLDLDQRLANGLGTNLAAPTASSEPNDEAPAPRRPVNPYDEAEQELLQLKLEAARRKDRAEREEEAARAGRYVDAEDVNQQMGRLAARLVSEFEGSLPDLATAIAAQFRLEQRDVLHTIRQALRASRAKASAEMRAAAEQLPQLEEVPDELSVAAE